MKHDLLFGVHHIAPVDTGVWFPSPETRVRKYVGESGKRLQQQAVDAFINELQLRTIQWIGAQPDPQSVQLSITGVPGVLQGLEATFE